MSKKKFGGRFEHENSSYSPLDNKHTPAILEY